MLRPHQILPSLAALLIATSVALAAPGDFVPEQTSAKATWLAHLNLVKMRDSEIGKQLIGEMDGESKRNLRQLKRMLNFHPIEDLDSVTVYGTSTKPEEAVALMRGKFDTDRLTGVARDGDNYKAFNHKTSTIHSWTDGEKRVYANIAEPRLIVIGPELDLLKLAIEVIDGSADSLKGKSIFGHTPNKDETPILIAAANLEALEGLEIDSSLVRKISSLYFSTGENDGVLMALVALKTKDARSAQLVSQMLHGVLALAEATDEVPREITEAFKTELSDDSLSLRVDLPIKKFKELVSRVEKAAEGLK